MDVICPDAGGGVGAGGGIISGASSERVVELAEVRPEANPVKYYKTELNYQIQNNTGKKITAKVSISDTGMVGWVGQTEGLDPGVTGIFPVVRYGYAPPTVGVSPGSATYPRVTKTALTKFDNVEIVWKDGTKVKGTKYVYSGLIIMNPPNMTR
jgi:hypothetical protein